MTSTRYVVADGDADLSKLAATYVRQPDGQFVRRPGCRGARLQPQGLGAKPGAFGLVSTLDDYARFARMLLNKRRPNSAHPSSPRPCA